MKRQSTQPKVVVAHGATEDGKKHLVAAQMRVFVCHTHDGYVAQGLEIDYCSVGDTVDEVQKNFARGFLATVESLIKRKRPLSALFKSKTPPEIWQEYIDSQAQDNLICGTIVDLTGELPTEVPYQQLAFCAPRQMALA
ncbi:hypothetical protein [Stenotrophomonas rhizophila]|uniref:hypothetical protein n=1 Tax=Stenotrophomonas rhizophila TaxID=216778 RepID=UPI0028A5BC57|nr:hypothetical protein [Stenotrophomonas rhizophila]